MAIITKETVVEVITTRDVEYVSRYIGRALVCIFNRQTSDEQSSNTTSHDNGIGFTGGDAVGGSLSAKYFLKHGRLEGWQIQRWTKPNSKGIPRIAKYHRQLNEEAEKRAKIKAA